MTSWFFGSKNKDQTQSKNKDNEENIDPRQEISMRCNNNQDDDLDDEGTGINGLMEDLESEEQSLLKRSKDKFDQKLDEKITKYSQPNFFMLFTFFGIGSLFLFAAAIQLPFMLLNPRGFILYWTLS